MPLIYSNGPSKDFVINPFQVLLDEASELFLAAPYFTEHALIVDAARKGKVINLLIGLNPSTSPLAIDAVRKEPSVSVRYFTNRFHAKIYFSDKGAMLGSANLTGGGFVSNREAVCVFDPQVDGDKIDELRSLFAELWSSAPVLTEAVARTFAAALRDIQNRRFDAEAEITQAVGLIEPANIRVGSGVKSRKRLFLDGLQQRIYEQYRPSFLEVKSLLATRGYRRAELAAIGLDNETNRFLNWVRREKAPGDEWQISPLQPNPAARAVRLDALGAEWVEAKNSHVSETFASGLQSVQAAFGYKHTLENAQKEVLMRGLLSLHAFAEQSRFEGGQASLEDAFWQNNNNNVARISANLSHFLYGSGDFVQRLHDILYDPSYKLRLFGIFCCLELMGTVRPDICPPINGRMAKALRFIGFDVRTS